MPLLQIPYTNLVFEVEEWVAWIAMDCSGAWWSFEYKPVRVSLEKGGKWLADENIKLMRSQSLKKHPKDLPKPNWINALYKLEDVICHEIKIPLANEIVALHPKYNYVAMDYRGRWAAYVDKPYVHAPPFDHDWLTLVPCIGASLELPAFTPELTRILDWKESLYKVEELLCPAPT